MPGALHHHAYCNRDWNFPYKIDHDDLCFRLFTEAGFDWGGDWTTFDDPMHFSPNKR